MIKRKDQKADYIPFPFYLAYTAALLEKEKGVEVFVEDSIALNQTKDDFLEKFVQVNPDVVLFETSTNTLYHDIELIKELKSKKPSVVVCLAGFHVTSLAKETFKAASNSVDFLLLREYELNFVNLVRVLRVGGRYERLPGIAYVENDAVVENEPRELTDVNTLPFPARHLFPSNEVSDMSVYWDGFCQYKPAIQMHASRGCPFRCNFCVWNQLMYKNGKYRPRDVSLVCDEIEQVIRDYDAREIYFDDDTFTGNKQHVLDFCVEILKRGLDKRVVWSAMADFMITDEEMILKMKEAGCVGLKFGVESGNKEVLKRIQKPINFDKLRENLRLCAKLHIKTHGTFTFGLSGETKDTINETFNLAKSLDCDSLQFSVTTPFPGTRYYEELKNEGRLLSENWEDFDGNSNSVIKFDDMDSNYIGDFYRKATGEWLKHKLTDPSWVLRQLYNLGVLIKGQGIEVVLARIKRFSELLGTAI